MDEIVYLTLENGDVYRGYSFGEDAQAIGEVVFTTAMTGYCETLTDKSYYGQIVVQAFPLIGNYGVIPDDYQSETIHAAGYIVSDWCRRPSNFRSEGTLDTFLKSEHIPGIYGIDTRNLIKTIRENGAMNGIISKTPGLLDAMRGYRAHRPVERVSVATKQLINVHGKHKVAVFDFGCKKNIILELIKRNCCVTVYPFSTAAEEILGAKPDGVLLTNGPGDPAENAETIEEIKNILKCKVPVFGICLGHQMLALANGFSREKLKFGHRGANQPVKDLLSGRTYITSQNHGYAIIGRSITSDVAQELFVNVNDGTNEGIIYKHINAFSVQFHPEGCGGPQDTNYLFDMFVKRIEGAKNA